MAVTLLIIKYGLIIILSLDLGLCAFLIAEQRATMPMLPLNLFRIKAFSASIIIGMVLNIGFYGELFVLPLYFQHLTLLIGGIVFLLGGLIASVK